MSMTASKRSRLRRPGRRGTELIEFSLVFIPFLMFMALTMNIAWAVFTRATVQYAVQQGVRYAITSQTLPGMDLRASIQTYVQQESIGLLNSNTGTAGAIGQCGWNHIYVNFNLVNLDGTLTNLDNSNSACGGSSDENTWQTQAPNLPLVEVSVQNLPGIFLFQFVKLPGMGSVNPIQTSAAAWDRMGAPPLNALGAIAVPAQ